ncbi:MAG: hypothetical protein COZ46_00860 [Verrucomicrobia bacterium CG_4_10_14_3_um_filter_43_23]|nr:MAG: hypothetical protein AUJ82_05675 [Verrucomicrobia bacterium CG1_02_43_26]PIP58706.1 MAG: hypothetical protein COX01_07410 [Verrucomicrobia bacterium CG22_combo_CG10-13_8_21_14_all_43_17]PIX59027.1 MAG: hypothetical protein COZ46_00860 [Verrucomicrobia bacterium CG_4_10_14_3_um_filter_43_23]PIY61600.1 MAG: hypothetical protein COY94_04505 [Verrucomicrobia bacterium CG_4_10_14_0_8_um_filter_43_34]PJA44509.1 MAG: hypothetical protein CO175_02525 [Verrucomicrobia bacterium CG_4_9_14_3_um_fi
MTLPRIHLAILEKLFALNSLTADGKEKALSAADGLSGEEMEGLLKKDFGISDLEILVAKSLSLSLNPFLANRFEMNHELFNLLPRDFCEKNKMLPVSMFDGRVVVAVTNPFNLDLIQAVKDKTKLKVSILLALEKDIEHYLSEEETDAKKLRVKKSTTPLIFPSKEKKPTEWMPQQAIQLSGSPFRTKVTEPFLKAIYGMMVDTVLIEPDIGSYKILYRLDAKPLKQEEVPYKVGKELIDDVRKLANMDDGNPMHPHESVLAYSEEGDKTYYFRVTSAILNHHQSLLLEPVEQSWVSPKLAELGIKEYQLDEYVKFLEADAGLLLHSSPYKAGLSTTLYAGLNWFEGTDKVIRAVDYSHSFLQLNAGVIPAEPDFASACRAALKQRPEILMIREVKDDETAQLALDAALFNNLVLAGTYAHNAIEGIERILALGVSRSMFTNALKVSCSQRLLRKLCEYCKEPYTPEDEEIDLLQKSIGWYGSVYRKSKEGCTQCNRSGWHGYAALFEFLFPNERFKKALRDGRDSRDLLRIARNSGLRTFHEESMDGVKAGLFDMAYALKQVPPDEECVEEAKKGALALSR